MLIAFDPEKNERNVRQRDLRFERAAEFDFANANVFVDSRKDYGVDRYIAIGYLQGRLHVLCFTETAVGIRVISFRKANDQEVKFYAKVQIAD